MPFTRITTFGKALDSGQIGRLQAVVTDLMATIMRKPLNGISVLVEMVCEAGWSVAGKPINVGAHVEATIGAGQNTPEEKAQFMLKGAGSCGEDASAQRCAGECV